MANTKGLWKVLEDRAIVDSNNVLIAQTSRINDRNMENARLISAAPEMYDALCMLEFSHTAEQQEAFFKAMHKALAKARGKV